MMRTIVTATALAIFTAGAGLTGSASAGGGAAYIVTKSKPSLLAHNKHGTRIARHEGTEITEFSSSSARHFPGR